MLAASPDLTASSVRPEDSKQTAPGIQSPLKQAGFMGMIFGWMMRRFSNLAIGAGVPSSVQVIEVEVDTWLGHVRVVNVHTGIAVGKIAAPALARSQAAGASSRASATRSMKRAKSIPAPAMCSAAAWRTIAFPESRTRQ